MLFKLEPRGEHSKAMAYLSPLLAGILTLITGGIFFYLQGNDPLYALKTMLYTPISDVYGLTELCVKTAPILLCAIGLAVVFKAQVWNIGAEGQLLMGGLAASALAVNIIDIEGVWVLPMVMLVGMLGGGLWALLAAWLKTHFNANEILTTIMLNYIALNFLIYSVHGPLKDPHGYNFPESAMFGDAALLPILVEGTRVHAGILFALFAVVVVWVLLSRSFIGFQIKVLGLDASAARFAGFKDKKLVWITMLISGALAGLAGAGEVAGPLGQLVPQISPGYGYAAIIVAFLGRLHPIGILFASLLMALIYMGGEMAQIMLNMPLAITGLFQGMLLFYLLACDVLIGYKIKFPWLGTKAAASSAE
ncbi:ABC transporter permease [Neptunomonas antarctica]|uniref:Nucleoside ABC transporter membrane protein n=1 Tax=Neptunomonas antarctica TaxID=619304 RepID=A0A1N7IT08_9GAMM|nr:ABC transporter permease [Neptunomonas antarctica]SIS40146.1 nucleoside ABC transporter membrane protein [Neptunomonas antarctica]